MDHLFSSLSSIVVRAIAYCAEDPRFETHFEPMVGRMSTVQTAVNRGPGGNTGEIKVPRKGTGLLLHKADGPGQVSSLTGSSPTYGSYMGLNFYVLFKMKIINAQEV